MASEVFSILGVLLGLFLVYAGHKSLEAFAVADEDMTDEHFIAIGVMHYTGIAASVLLLAGSIYTLLF